MSTESPDPVRLFKESREMIFLDDQPFIEEMARMCGVWNFIFEQPVVPGIGCLPTETATHFIAFLRFQGTDDDGLLMASCNKDFWSRNRFLKEIASFILYCQGVHTSK